MDRGNETRKKKVLGTDFTCCSASLCTHSEHCGTKRKGATEWSALDGPGSALSVVKWVSRGGRPQLNSQQPSGKAFKVSTSSPSLEHLNMIHTHSDWSRRSLQDTHMNRMVEKDTPCTKLKTGC